jgi:hypothetical protein
VFGLRIRDYRSFAVKGFDGVKDRNVVYMKVVLSLLAYAFLCLKVSHLQLYLYPYKNGQ